MNRWFRLAGLSLALSLTACGSSGGSNDILDENQLYAYRSDSPYAAVLKDCALAKEIVDTCTLQTLPFIAQQNSEFTRADIMNRLLVTHDWMGERFEALLNDAPEKMIPLFGSLTSISIGSTVRPSYYWAGIGGIRLDPAGLWLTVDEKANVSAEEDYRSGFGDGLQFWFFETLRNGNQPAINYYSLSDDSERPYEDIKVPMYQLLYHELAHAVDFLPTESIPSLNASLNPAQALTLNENFFLSPRMYNDMPLNSQVLDELSQVSFRGVTATDAQISYQPDFLGAEMANDGASRYYGYYTQREDFATLFAVAMMKLDFNLDSYVGFVNKPANLESYFCSELLVGWGQKNRLADALVQPRAKWALEQVYGQRTEFDNFFAENASQLKDMVPGVNWCDNRDNNYSADLPFSDESKIELSDEQKAEAMQRLEFERRVRIH